MTPLRTVAAPDFGDKSVKKKRSNVHSKRSDDKTDLHSEYPFLFLPAMLSENSPGMQDTTLSGYIIGPSSRGSLDWLSPRISLWMRGWQPTASVMRRRTFSAFHVFKNPNLFFFLSIPSLWGISILRMEDKIYAPLRLVTSPSYLY
jgi:hypothetical protein